MRKPFDRTISSDYRPELEGLRSLAVLGVLIFHVFPNSLEGGFKGVDVFFVLSGFLISQLALKQLERGTFKFSDFYLRRFLRLAPALALVLLSSWALGWFILLPEDYGRFGRDLLGASSFVLNLLLQNGTGYFEPSSEAKPLLHLWSLGAEAQFYLIWPVVLVFCWKRHVNFRRVIFWLIFVSMSLYITMSSFDPDLAFYSPATRLWEFLCGAALAIFSKNQDRSQQSDVSSLLAKMRSQFQQSPWTPWFNQGAPILGFILILSSFLESPSSASTLGLQLLFPVLGSLLVISGSSKSWFERRILASPWMMGIGQLSFPLYFWHWPLLAFARILHIEEPSLSVRGGVILSSFLLAWLTFRFIESPIRFGPSDPKAARVLVAFLGLAGLVGFATYNTGGFPSRFKGDLLMDEATLELERHRFHSSNFEKEFSSRPFKVVVFGDSQAFDIYKSLENSEQFGLKMISFDHGCTAFSLFKRGFAEQEPTCKEAYVQLLSSPELKVAHLLIVSQWWSQRLEPKSTSKHYRRVLSQIRSINPDLRIAFFGPKPYLAPKSVSINRLVKGHSSVQGMNHYLNRIHINDLPGRKLSRELANNLGIDYVDVYQVFCKDECPFFVDEKFAYFDQNHWTAHGAKIFFDRLNKSPQFQKLINP
ncbi:MAG: acyltransferase family protein [Bdellovibrionales bacterium]